MGIRLALVTGPEENMGAKYISAVLKSHNHQTELFVDPQLFNDEIISIKRLGELFNLKNKLINDILNYNPHLIGFSVNTDFYAWALDLATRLKSKSNIPIIFGGIHPSSVPDEVMRSDFVDMVCIGEGEYAVLDLADSLENNNIRFDIKNIWFKNKGEIIRNSLRPLADVNNLPFPDHELYYKKNKYFRIGYHTISSRGCFNRCSYCCHSFLKSIYGEKEYYRVRNVKNIIGELRQNLQRYKFRIIRFYDDIFPCNIEWLKEFSCAYKNYIKLPFICYLHPALVNEERIFLLNKAGCCEIRLGIQTLNPKIRKDILNRHESNEDVEMAMDIITKNGIKIVTENILGLPTQHERDAIKLLKFYNKNRPARNHFFWLRYYPGIEISRYRDDVDEKNSVIESNKVFTQGGDTHIKTDGRLTTALYLLPLLPRWLVKIIIDNNIWRYLPSLPLSMLNLFANLTSSSYSDRITRLRTLNRYKIVSEKLIKWH